MTSFRSETKTKLSSLDIKGKRNSFLDYVRCYKIVEEKAFFFAHPAQGPICNSLLRIP
jgi:hypothetical protein